MRGSLALHQGVLYVGSEERTAHVRAFDLDGTPLEAGFSFRGEQDGAASVDGLCVDPDHRVWIADGTGGRLLGFSLVGSPLANVAGLRVGTHDGHGVLGRCSAVECLGEDDDQLLIVASGGTRRHAVQVLPLSPEHRQLSLRPMGDQDGTFRDVRGLAIGRAGREVLVCEAGAQRVQVFLDFDFQRSIAVPTGATPFEPNALAVCEDGRLLIAQGGEHSALLLCTPSGRILNVLAPAGTDEGQVQDPGDVVIEPGALDRYTRVLVIDRDGLRVQAFNLEGNCWGAFLDHGAPELERESEHN